MKKKLYTIEVAKSLLNFLNPIVREIIKEITPIVKEIAKESAKMYLEEQINKTKRKK